MLLQVKNKRGVSVVIGYVLLIAISIVMSVLVYSWLKTYVPSETLQCPEGASIFIENYSYDCTTRKLAITLQNNGKFSLAGFFIHVSTSPESEAIATIDLSSRLSDGGINQSTGGSILYKASENGLTPDSPNNIKTSTFNVANYGNTLKEVEIIPLRFQEEDNKKRVVSCSDAKVKETLVCN